jgi:hypothetical protein
MKQDAINRKSASLESLRGIIPSRQPQESFGQCRGKIVKMIALYLSRLSQQWR